MNKNDKPILVFSSADIHNYRNWKESLVFTETYKTIDLVILAGDIQDIYTNTCLQEFPGGLEVKIPGYHYPN